MDRPAAFAPQKFREIVFQLIYSQDFGGDLEVVELLMAQLQVTKRILRLALERREAFLEKKEQIDALVVQHSQSYALERIPRVERAIVRLGMYEMLFCDEIPPKVAIAEALRLTRKFATAEGAQFVNALLDSLYKGMDRVSECVQPV